MKKTIATALIILLLVAAALLAAIAFGGPGEPAPMTSISEPFRHVDFSSLPPLRHYPARDAAQLAFRTYAPAGAARGSVVLIHGSSGSSTSMHVLAQALAAAGYTPYALDMRGHGDSGPKGRIAYVGQLEDDVEDFLRAVPLAQPITLVGFSSGGGFALRLAGSARQKLFARYVLLSPFISQNSPTQRNATDRWARVGIPRYVAIGLLHSVGVTAFDDLPVIRYAVDREGLKRLTPSYSYALAQNFRPQRDYQATIRAMTQPARLLAGTSDELFDAAQFDPLFKAQGKDLHVQLLPGVGHIGLTLDPQAVQAVVTTVAQPW